MVSGSDEHGTPITVTAETQNIEPQQVVDEFHKTNRDALIALGCAWAQSIDPRGPDYGGALFNRTSDPEHKRMVQKISAHWKRRGSLSGKRWNSTTRFIQTAVDGFYQTATLRAPVLLAAATVLVGTNATHAVRPTKRLNSKSRIENESFCDR